MPHAHGAMLTGLKEHLEPPQIIVLRGRGESLECWRVGCAAPTPPAAKWSRCRTTRLGYPECSRPVNRFQRGSPSPVSGRGTATTPLTSFEDLEAALRTLDAG